MNNCRITHVETWAIAGGTRSLQSWPRLWKMENIYIYILLVSQVH